MISIFSRLGRLSPPLTVEAFSSGRWNRPLSNLLACLFVCEGSLQSYRKVHTFPRLGNGPFEETAIVQLAVVRLESLLEQGRQELGGRFDMWDISVLQNSYLGDFVPPDDSDELVEVVSSMVGLPQNQADEKRIARLLGRLGELSALQRTSLFDALEVMYYSGDETVDVLKRLGIRLR